MCQGDTHNDVLTPFEEDALDAMLTHATALREHPPGSDAVYNAADALRYARRVARFASAVFELERAVLDPNRANLGVAVAYLPPVKLKTLTLEDEMIVRPIGSYSVLWLGKVGGSRITVKSA